MPRKKSFKRESQNETPALKPGLVIASHGANVEVEDNKGQRHHCINRKKTGPAICGDHVMWHSEPHHTGLIHSIINRKNVLARPDAHNKLKAVAANIDHLVISLAPVATAIQEEKNSLIEQAHNLDLIDFHAIDRYIVAAEISATRALIVINKIDLLSEKMLDEIRARLNIYAELGYPYVLTSTQRGQGLDNLSQYLAHKTSVFVGQSGVGKSSLIKIFIGEENIQIGSLSKVTGQGRHTTTTTRLYHLNGGGNIIDSPGVREFGLWNIEAQKIMHAFKEFKPLLGMCKFNDCLHNREPNCAIKKAVQNGEIKQARYEAYNKILLSLDDPR